MTRLEVAALLTLVAVAAQDSGPYVPRIQPASEEAAQALQRFRPAAGIQVELFAAEPMLANPVAFALDHDGTVFVAETFRHHQGVADIRDHMDWLDDDLAARTVADRRAYLRKFTGDAYDRDYGRASEQVRRLVDRDGDGAADEATVFAAGFADHAAGIGAGLLSYRGDVFYSCIPDLWRLGDADGDGVAEQRTALSSGYGVHFALLGHDLHGLRIGPDRRLYFTCGDRGFHVETPAGTLAHAESGAVLRCELDGSGLEVWHDGLRNPQELSFDELGNLWTGDNNSDGGDRARWVNVVEGGDSGWRGAYQWITEPVARGPWNDEKLWHPPHEGQAAYLVPPVANLADGPAGLTHYPGTGLPAEYAGHFFLCDFRGDVAASGIHTFTVRPKGAFFELGPVTPFLWGALVTDCDFGPDGALWFSDWVYGWEMTGKGRLYRCVDPASQGSALVEETRSLLARGMDGRALDELVELLDHPDQRVRQEAHFELSERDEVASLAGLVLGGGKRLLARLHAVWALGIALRNMSGSQGADVQGLLLAACEASDTSVGGGDAPSPESAEVRAQAIRVLGDARCAAAAPMAVRLLSDPSPRVRFFAAIAAGRLKAPGAVEGLAQLLRDAGASDPNLRHAAVMGITGCAGPKDIERLSLDPAREVRLGALLALRRRADPTIARFLLDQDARLALEAARAIHDVPIPGALESLASARVDKSRLEVGERAFVRRVLGANYRLGRAATLARFVERADLSVESRVEALDMLARWERPSSRDRVTGEWRPIPPRAATEIPGLALELSRSLGAAPDPVVEAFARLSGAVRAEGVSAFLAELVGGGRGSAVKSAALEALEAMGAPNLVPAVRSALEDRDGRVRASALERLARLAPTEALARTAAVLAEGELSERRAAYAILARNPGPAAVEALAPELERWLVDLVPAELALDLVAACEAQGDAHLSALLARRAATRSADPLLAPYLDALFGGERKRGSAVFERVDLSCTRCHASWKDAAERVGPNLFGVGQRLTRLQILEAILAPNRHTTPGFGATALFLADGRVLSGRVIEENPSLVRLLDADNKPVALDASEIDEKRADLSSMPEDLGKSIAPRDMRDLLEYLATL